MQYPEKKHFRRTLILLAAALATPSFAQDAAPPPPSTALPGGVTIPDSPGVTERLAKAREKEQQHQWKTAAEFYQEIIEKYAGRVTPVKTDADAGIFQYAGVADLVHRRLASWPAEGITDYHQAYEQTADDLLAAAAREDVTALDRIFTAYFITDAGKTAGLRLMDLHLEAGRFAAAKWTGQQLLNLHPALSADRAAVLFRTALASQWSGDSKTAQSLLDELKTKHAADTGSIAGKDVLLADALAAALQSPQPHATTQPTDADHWPRYGGPGGRAEISPSVAAPGAASVSIPLVPNALDKLTPQQRSQYEAPENADINSGAGIGIMPVADGGSLFFQDGRFVYAVSADSGQPLPGWAKTYAGDKGGRYSIDMMGRPRGEQLTVAVTDTRLLAVMGQADRNALALGQLQGDTITTRLVCLDRESGKEIWTRKCGDLPDSAAAIRPCVYNGTALVIPGTDGGDSSVLMVARAGTANQFEDCYVVCLSLKTGDYKWSTYIGSATRMVDGGETGALSQESSQLAVAEGRVFVLSNLGTVAAIDPADGRMIWLDSYPRDVNDNPEMAMMAMRRRMMNRLGERTNGSKPWSHNPVVISDGKVFVLPSDGKFLHIYDAGSGAEVKRINLLDYDGLNMLLGVRGDWIIAANNDTCFCLDWKLYQNNEAGTYAALVWKTSKSDGIIGRGFLTTDSIFLPTKKSLNQISFDRFGRVVDTYPKKNGSWGVDEEPGNVLVTSQNVVVAGTTRVNVYTDLTLVRRQYEAQIAATPGNAEPHVRYAAVLYSGGQSDEAIAHLDTAIELLGGKTAMRSTAARELLFSTTMGLAQKAAGGSAAALTDENPAGKSPLADQLFDRAALAEDGPGENAAYRLARAGYDQDRHDYVGVVRLGQEILSDESMRSAVITESSTAGAAAEEVISAAVQMDRSSYAKVQEAAAAELAAAKGAGDPSRLLMVADVYPNSTSAGDARTAAVALFQSRHDHASAIKIIRQIFPITKENSEKVKLLEALARNLLATPGGAGAAMDRLVQANRIERGERLSEPLVLPDGTALQANAFGDALGALRKLLDEQDSARLPDFHVPIRAGKSSKPFETADAVVIPNVAALIRPEDEFSRSDRVVTWSPAGLAVFSPGNTTPVMAAAEVTEQPVGAAWTGDRLVVWTSNAVTLLDASGRRSWAADVRALPAMAIARGADAVTDEVKIDGEPGANANVGQINGQVFINGQRVILNNANGRVMFLRGGVVRIGGPQAVPAAGGGAKNADEIASVRPVGNRILVTTTGGSVIGIDAGDGHVAWQLRLLDHAVNQLLANADFTVARLDDPAGSQLVVMDTASGRVIGRRKFDADNMAGQLVNAALSEDGTLVYTLFARIMSKDLYEEWKTPATELPAAVNADVTQFSGLNLPGQLVVRSGRVLALYNGGKFVRVVDLTGSTAEREPLATGAPDGSPVTMQFDGAKLFVTNSRGFRRYSLENVDDHFDYGSYEFDYVPKIRELMLGKDQAVLVNDPADRAAGASPAFVQWLMYRRAPNPGAKLSESGVLDYVPMVKDPSGIAAWQPTDGGFCYLGGDQQLHFMRGARK